MFFKKNFHCIVAINDIQKFFFHQISIGIKEKLLDIVERYNAMELLLEEHLGSNVHQAVHSLLLERADEIHERNNDFFIATVGEILTQNE